MEPRVGELERNLILLQDVLREAKQESVDVLVLPELANSGYAFENLEDAISCSESIPGGSYSKELLEYSSDGRLVVAGICERRNDSIFNSAGVFADGEHRATYRKAHLFNKEKMWFRPGAEEPPIIEYNGHVFGVMICWDWIFPEFARILALKGAHAILHPSNLVLQYCQNAMRTRCLENGVYAITANRTGTERGLAFSGGSQVVNPKGEVLLSATEEFVGIMHIDVDLSEADDKMLTPRNDRLKDRRPKLYRRIIESL